MQILFFHLNCFSIFIKVLGFKILLSLFVFVLWTLIERDCRLKQVSFNPMGGWSSPQKFSIIFRGSIWHQPVRLGEVTKMAPYGYCNYGNWNMRCVGQPLTQKDELVIICLLVIISSGFFLFASIWGGGTQVGTWATSSYFYPTMLKTQVLGDWGPPGTAPLRPLWLGTYSIRPENVEMHIILGSNQGPT